MSSLASNTERPISMVKLRPDTHREDDRTLLRLSPIISSKLPELIFLDRTQEGQRPVESRELPEPLNCDWMRPVGHDRT